MEDHVLECHHVAYRTAAQCSAPIQPSEDRVKTHYFRHSSSSGKSLAWIVPEGVCCWHDLHVFTSTPWPSVRSYDEKKNLYEVFGYFCSGSCAKAYMLERSHVYTAMNLMHLTHMAIHVYGIREPIICAPPQIRLSIMGGDLSITEFRQRHVNNCTSVVVAPPFVTCTMLFEERKQRESSEKCSSLGVGITSEETPDALEAPNHSAPLFTHFITKTANQPVITVPVKRKRCLAKNESMSGTLETFMRHRKTKDKISNDLSTE